MQNGLSSVNPRLPIEFRFLVVAMRVALGTSQAAELHALAAIGKIDWDIVCRGMVRNGLSQLVPILIDAGRPAPEYANALRRAAAKQEVETLVRVAETVRIAEALEAGDVRFLIVKGVPLSVQLYASPNMRAMRDIDLIVDREDAQRADAILQHLGYARKDSAPWEGAMPGYGPHIKETVYRHDTKHVAVELHDRLTDNPELLPWDFGTLWAEREKPSIGGRPVPTMARHRLLPYVCVHGARHCWARLLWLEDLAALLRTPQDFRNAIDAADALGLRSTMLHAFWMLDDWLGQTVPAEYLTLAQASKHVRLLNRIVHRAHMNPSWRGHHKRDSWHEFLQSSVLTRIFAYLMKPNRRYWSRQLALDIASPADQSLVLLPRSLFWLYFFIRPFGWLIRRSKI